jgi:3-hydroxyacyl-[acyl-carrier-protein] dehydratase
MRFLLVDRIVRWSPEGVIHGVKNVAMTEDVLEHHFPGRPVMPGSLLLEALVQLAGWLEAASSDFESWFLVDRVHRCGFYDFALPGDQVELEVHATGPAVDGRRGYRGSGSAAGNKRISADFEGRLFDLAELEDPEAQRRLFESLTGEGRW